MHSILKILTVSIFSGITSLTIVANNTSRNIAVNNNVFPNYVINKRDIYNISVKEILNITPYWSKSKKNLRYLNIYESEIWGTTNLPSNIWQKNHPINGRFTRFHIYNDNIWEKIALIYGFNHNSSQDEIIKLMHDNPIANVTMTISLTKKGKWKLLDFNATNWQWFIKSLKY